MINQIKKNIDELKVLVQKPRELPIKAPKEAVETPKPMKPSAPLIDTQKLTGPVSEEEIADFRKSILKPTPPPEKFKRKPTSIRAELIDEMKDFFEAVKKVKKKEDLQ